MTKVGPIVPVGGCGFSPEVSDVVCGEPPVLHAWIEGSNVGDSYAMACERHASYLRTITSRRHEVTPPCFDIAAAWWLDRTDGTSFCYLPDDDAELQAELAAGATTHPLVNA